MARFELEITGRSSELSLEQLVQILAEVTIRKITLVFFNLELLSVRRVGLLNGNWISAPRQFVISFHLDVLVGDLLPLGDFLFSLIHDDNFSLFIDLEPVNVLVTHALSKDIHIFDLSVVELCDLLDWTIKRGRSLGD